MVYDYLPDALSRKADGKEKGNIQSKKSSNAVAIAKRDKLQIVKNNNSS